MKQLILVIGNISSGKTTIAKKIGTLRFIPAVSRDSFRYMLGQGQYYYGRVEAAIMMAEEVLIECIMKTGQSVIIDDASNVMSFVREKWITLATNFGYEVIVIETPKLSMPISVKRRMKDNHGGITKKKWEQVYHKFDELYDQPRLEEGIDNIFFLTGNKKADNDMMADLLLGISSDYFFDTQAKNEA